MNPVAPTQDLVERWTRQQLQRRPRSTDGRPVRKALGLRARPAWSSTRTTIDGIEIDLRVCPSPLSIRQALAEHDPRDLERQLVVITDYDHHALGADVLARIADGRLRTIEERDIVAAMFRVQSIEPRLRRSHAIVRALIEGEPPEGWDAEPSGVLSYDRAVALLLAEQLGIEDANGGLTPLFAWASSEQSRRFATVGTELADVLSTWLVERHGAAAKLTMATVQAGRGEHVVAYALAARLITVDNDDVAGRERARVRLEHLLGMGNLTDAQLATWATAAERYARKRLADGVSTIALAPGSAAVLDELGLVDAAGSSEVLPEGYASRAAAFAGTLESVIAAASPQSLALAAQAEASLRTHALAGTQHFALRTRMCEAALRLGSWLVHGNDERAFATSDAAVSWYVTEGSWVDQVRDELAAADTGITQLDDVIERLLKHVGQLRHAQNEAFAQAIVPAVAHDSLDDSGDYIGVEHIAGRVVASVAERDPALLLVIDGLSIPAWQQLAESVIARGWDVVEHAETKLPSAALSTVPSVTEVARTSLFTGTVREGTERDETSGFASIARIKAAVAAAGARGDALLLHKADLRGDGARPLAPDARRVIADAQQHVVGVVVNAIDDLLAKADQAHVAYDIDLMPVLVGILDAAAEAGRIVVITSDHGHVLDRGTQFAGFDGAASARWRPTGEAPRDGEIAVAGTRVVVPGGSLVAAWSESIRYTKGRSRGYHGGVAPQELVVPIVVLQPSGVQNQQFVAKRVNVPDWWNVTLDGTDATAVAPAPTSISIGKPAVTPPNREAVPTLFDAIVPAAHTAETVERRVVAVASWIEQLTNTDRLQGQIGAARRIGVTTDQVRDALAALDARGGTASTGVVAQAVGLPEIRVSGFLSALRRVLTWDGVDVMEIDHAAGIVTLNVQRLREQFGVSAQS